MATEIRIAKQYMKIKPKCEIGKIWQIEMNTALHDINLTKFGLTNYQMYIDMKTILIMTENLYTRIYLITLNDH